MYIDGRKAKSCVEKRYRASSKITNILYGLAVPLLGKHTKELKAGLQRHTCTSVFTAASFIIDVEEVEEVEVAQMSTDG